MTTATDWTLTTSAADNVTDLYAQLVAVKNGKRGCHRLTKKHAKANRIEWSFVEDSCRILGLTLKKNNGSLGYIVFRAESPSE